MTLPTYWPGLAVSKLQEILAAYCTDNLPDDDPARVAVIRIGRFQSSPASAGVILEIYENDPVSPSIWAHEILTESKTGDTMTPRAVIGRPTSYWRRRFTINVTVFLRGTTREASYDIKDALLYRIEQAILDNQNLGGLKDTAGETSFHGQIWTEFGAVAGDDRNPIWRHTIRVEFRTKRSQ